MVSRGSSLSSSAAAAIKRADSVSTCLFCYSEEDTNNPSTGTRVSNLSGDDTRFVLRTLLQLSNDQFPAGIECEGSSRNAEFSTSSVSSSTFLEIKFCRACRLETEQAKLIYLELVLAVRQFREIQQRLVNKVKNNRFLEHNCHNEPDDWWSEKCRQLIIQNIYEKTDAFVIDGQDIQVQDSLLSNLGRDDLDVQKTEVKVDTDEHGDGVGYEHLEVEDEDSICLPTKTSCAGSGSEISHKESFLRSNEHADDQGSMAQPNEMVDTNNVDIKTESYDSEDSRQDDVEDISWSASEGPDANGSGDCDQDSNEEDVDNAGDDEQVTNDAVSAEESSLKCDKCVFIAKTKRGLQIHIGCRHKIPKEPERKASAKSSVERKHKCPVDGCEESFARRYNLNIHITKHAEQPQFKCSVCSEEFYESDKLRRHRQRQHPEACPPKPNNSEIERFPCHLCPRVLVQKVGLKKHLMRAHNIQPPKGRPCPEEGCDVRVKGIAKLREHLYEYHGKEPYYKCSKCDAAFPDWKKKWRHEQMFHEEGLSKRPFICEFCGKGFPCQEYLSTHRHIHHSDKKNGINEKNEAPQICDLCGKELKNVGSLKAHILQVHEKHKLKHI